VHALHDPTEGGLATGLWELAEAASAGLEVYGDAIPILPETQLLCRAMGLDALGLIASGTLLMAVAASDADAILSALAQSGIAATMIGRVLEEDEGVSLHTASDRVPLPRFERDEIARLFD
jgi:hydrogenase maturation factor